MKSYIELAKQLKDTKADEAEKHRKASAEALQKVRELKEKRADAIVGGRQAEHKSICQDIEYYEERAKHEADQASRTEIPADGYHKAWTAYREEYDREYAKILKYYCKLRDQMTKAYSEILEFINEGNREKDAYIMDAHISDSSIPALKMQTDFPKYRPNARHELSADGTLFVTTSNQTDRVSENVSEIERGIYVEGGVFGECTSEKLYKQRTKETDTGRLLWQANGVTEYLTREEFRERQLSHLTEGERKAFKRVHGL